MQIHYFVKDKDLLMFPRPFSDGQRCSHCRIKMVKTERKTRIHTQISPRVRFRGETMKEADWPSTQIKVFFCSEICRNQIIALENWKAVVFGVTHIGVMLKPEQVSWRAVENASEEVKCVYSPRFLSQTLLLLTGASCYRTAAWWICLMHPF